MAVESDGTALVPPRKATAVAMVTSRLAAAFGLPPAFGALVVGGPAHFTLCALSNENVSSPRSSFSAGRSSIMHYVYTINSNHSSPMASRPLRAHTHRVCPPGLSDQQLRAPGQVHGRPAQPGEPAGACRPRRAAHVRAAGHALGPAVEPVRVARCG
jgi:hypothetical protein